MSEESSDPREYIEAGRRLAVRRSEWLDEWWVSHSPRNSNSNAEGAWEEWVALAKRIIDADIAWRASLEEPSEEKQQ